ncbi:aldo/keto reductase [Acidimicrobiia bacterium EGI L10123]|uniref:aldo/keto reductase n=1 Tax=Salinilacustrithrix flava TaxID=2957203 RepID=UPI003D7C30C0|nr:aldo/keto reductase [Acidimicrobiia bacterium EGI L10123]
MIPTMPFGRTGHDSTRVLFGAAALGAMSQQRSDATLELIAGHGVNHIDTAASYGESELRLAPWLADHRAGVFLATKTGERTGPAARDELERSLTRLGVDHVDLIQLHNLVEEDEWQTAFAAGGVVEAMAAARDEGLVRHIGITGHGLRIAGMHQRSLEAFPFDSVLLPYSAVLLRDPGYREDVEVLRTTCRARGVAVQTIKAIARRRWREDDQSRRLSWYEPLRDPEAIDRAVRFVLAEPDLFLNTTSDATLLPLVLDAASRLDQPFDAPTDAELETDIEDQGIEAIFDGGALERI